MLPMAFDVPLELTEDLVVVVFLSQHKPKHFFDGKLSQGGCGPITCRSSHTSAFCPSPPVVLSPQALPP